MAIPLFKNEIWIDLDSFETSVGDGIIDASTAFIHLASTSVPSTFASMPWQEISQNVDPVCKLLDRIARRNCGAHFIFISSGGTVYGNVGSTKPVHEDTPVAPISAYGLGKVMIEEAVRFTNRTSELPYTILRIANPIGIHAHGGAQGLVLAALRAVQKNTSLHLFGDGSHIRDYLAADDVAEAILCAAFDLGSRCNTYNVGSGIGRSNLEMIRFVEKTIGQPVPLRLVPSRPIDVPAIVLDCAKIRDALGWRPKEDLKETVGAMWAARHTHHGLFLNHVS
ncbi:hypothetical protein AYO41_02100 [Verrucomicrobia bacterium SCGC AG-212-E04]|nr:hypothetical protein AYO41_02100 [Verrucomicrobia bacterium SCGC AG-212-E04]